MPTVHFEMLEAVHVWFPLTRRWPMPGDINSTSAGRRPLAAHCPAGGGLYHRGERGADAVTSGCDIVALTRPVSRSINECALTYKAREHIDYCRAAAEHDAYEACLRDLGVRVVSLPAQDDLPDAVFVEDTVVAVDEVATLTHPALASRQPEIETMAETISRFRSVEYLTGEARLEGGDVMRIDRVLYAGVSTRSNLVGIRQLADLLEPYGYRVHPTQFGDCLHLKTACTHIGRNTLLANPLWVDTSQFNGFDVVEAHPDEPEAGNAVLIGDDIILSASFPRTRERLETRGFTVRSVAASELEKAEAGLTCCSVLLTETHQDS